MSSSSSFYPEVYAHLGYQHEKPPQRAAIQSAPPSAAGLLLPSLATQGKAAYPSAASLSLPIRRGMAGDEQPYEEEVLHMLHFFLCQLRAQCEKRLGDDVVKRFDAEMERIDPEVGARDIVAAKVRVVSAKNERYCPECVCTLLSSLQKYMDNFFGWKVRSPPPSPADTVI